MNEVARKMHGLEKVDQVTLCYYRGCLADPALSSRCRIDERKYFFTQHIINLWNALLQDERWHKMVLSGDSAAGGLKSADKCMHLKSKVDD